MRNFNRQTAIIFAAAFIVFCAAGIVSACSIREDAMPRIREIQSQINVFVMITAGFFAAIIGLYFLNIFINRKWLLTLLFPFSALMVFIVSFVYVVIFAPMGFCGVDETYRTSLITLGLTAILFGFQLVLFLKSVSNRNHQSV